MKCSERTGSDLTASSEISSVNVKDEHRTPIR